MVLNDGVNVKQVSEREREKQANTSLASPVQVFVDTVGDPEKYANKIRARFPKVKVTVSKKADSLYPIVSASSICAKVVRDQIVHTWKINEFADDKQSVEYGSGYPGGERTTRRRSRFVGTPA